MNPMDPNETEGSLEQTTEAVNDVINLDDHRETVDYGQAAHQAAVEHIHVMYDLLDQESSGIEIDWSQTEAAAPFDGCTDCVVREILSAGIGSLEANGCMSW